MDSDLAGESLKLLFGLSLKLTSSTLSGPDHEWRERGKLRISDLICFSVSVGCFGASTIPFVDNS